MYASRDYQNVNQGGKQMRRRELAQLINDMFGGQKWELLDVTPVELTMARRVLLSPDWNTSVARHLGALVGYGELYNRGERTHKKWRLLRKAKGRKRDVISATRKNVARSQYISSALWMFGIMSAANLVNRALDMAEMKEREEKEGIEDP